MKKFLQSIGLIDDTPAKAPYNYTHSSYQDETNIERLIAHKDFLQKREEEEERRLNLIEGKTGQMVSQTGVIFSLLSLFTPLLIDKVSDVSWYLKLLFVFLLVLAFLLYLLTIRNALKNFNIKKFEYAIPYPGNVIKHQSNTTEKFYAEEIRDLLYCINKNCKLNNIKGTNLLHSHKAFKLGNIITAVLVSIFSISFLFMKESKIPIVQISNMDSLYKTTEYILRDTILIRDTVFIQLNDK